MRSCADKISSTFLVKVVLTLLLSSQYVAAQDLTKGLSYLGLALESFSPCSGEDSILSMSREVGRKPSEENYWDGSLNLGRFLKLPEIRIDLELDNVATIIVSPSEASVYSQGLLFRITLFAGAEVFKFTVKGKEGMPFPNMVSLKINDFTVCESPKKWTPTFSVADRVSGALVADRVSDALIATSSTEAPIIPSCGRRQVEHTPLIVSGVRTKAGDWPWHAALYKYSPQKTEQAYQCGGTLVSKTAVVTAAHCVTKNTEVISSELLLVILGKHNLKGRDPGSQEREVSRVIVADGFNTKLTNDIAILRLATEVRYNQYVQPICLWVDEETDKQQLSGLDGTVVGWGLNENDTLPDQLMSGSMNIVSDTECLLSYASFFEKFINEKSFCAGRRNGTSACNGDSGGGLVLPRLQPDGEMSWFLRGIVSVSVARADRAVCDPNHFVIFTDVVKFIDFIIKHMDRASVDTADRKPEAESLEENNYSATESLLRSLVTTTKKPVVDRVSNRLTFGMLG